MAITKEVVEEKIEDVSGWNVQVATDTVIKEDGTEISRSRHRHVLTPFKSSYDKETSSWVHTATDISGEDSAVQAIATAVWTDTVKNNYKTFVEAQTGI